MTDELVLIDATDPLFLDIVSRIAEALTPLQPTLTEEVVEALDAFALAVVKNIRAAQ
jgi:hypothetical protein